MLQHRGRRFHRVPLPSIGGQEREITRITFNHVAVYNRYQWAVPAPFLAWSADGRWMYFSADSGNGFHIWRQHFPNGDAEQITSGATEEEVARFIEEAQITGQLEHPSIPPVHELGTDEQGRPYYTMKVVRGITLAKVLELLRDGQKEAISKYSLHPLLAIFLKACEAVAFAHSKGIRSQARHASP